LFIVYLEGKANHYFSQCIGGTMSFNGFTEKTLGYFLTIGLDNTKSNFEANRQVYTEHVRDHLRALHEELVPALLEIDPGICVRQSRCVSGAYNDARFARSEPIKTYMYLHFCAETGRETDVPGFFLDASYDGYRYGLQLYHRTTQGMAKLRDAVLENEKRFSGIVGGIERRGEFTLEGESFKKEHYPQASPLIKNWLNRKSWWLGNTCPPDGDFFSAGLVKRLSEGYRSLRDLYRFMNDALR
jgi:uncharacterized protein (TIGR02453 family)